LRVTNTLCSRKYHQFKEDLLKVSGGIWSLDLFPDVCPAIRGPYDSVADAHRDRDLLWHYGERHGRYIWVVTPQAAFKLIREQSTFHSVEITSDTLSMELVRLRVRGPQNEWITVTNKTR
jgi:hypothetical protein